MYLVSCTGELLMCLNFRSFSAIIFDVASAKVLHRIVLPSKVQSHFVFIFNMKVSCFSQHAWVGIQQIQHYFSFVEMDLQLNSHLQRKFNESKSRGPLSDDYILNERIFIWMRFQQYSHNSFSCVTSHSSGLWIFGTTHGSLVIVKHGKCVKFIKRVHESAITHIAFREEFVLTAGLDGTCICNDLVFSLRLREAIESKICYALEYKA